MTETASNITDLDHLMMAVFDHDTAIELFKHIGFTIRPVRQLAPMGGGDAGGNGGSAAILLYSATPRCANYIEIARADPVTAQPFMKELLCQKEGPAMLVHATADPDALARHWRGLGYDLQQFGFTVQPFGAGEPVNIDIVLPLPGQAPFAFNACRYSDVSDFERDEYRDHANGARRWGGLTLAFPSDELAATVATYTAIYNTKPISAPSGGACFQPAANSLELVSTDQYQAAYGQWNLAPIVHIIVSDLEKTRFYFLAHDIACTDEGNRILISPELSGGAVFLFKQG